jgi:photosystem II stability/assembly factor-like uncharacterized protein
MRTTGLFAGTLAALLSVAILVLASAPARAYPDQTVASPASSWHVQNVPAGVSYTDSISCPSTSVCYAFGAETLEHAEILKTTNGGATWVAGASLVYFGTGAELSCPTVSVCFGAEVESNKVFTTDDGGASWRTDEVDNVTLSGVACYDASHCYVIGQAACGYAECGVAFSTTNGGASWRDDSVGTQSPGSLDAAPFSAIACTGPTTCIIVGYCCDYGSFHPEVARTTNGTSWTFELLSSVDATFQNVSCNDTEHCVATGTNGDTSELMTTSDGGSSWTKQLFRAYINSAVGVSCLASSATCWAVGDTTYSQYFGGSFDDILTTTNFGVDWSVQATFPFQSGDGIPGGIDCVEATHCWAGGGHPGGPGEIYSDVSVGSSCPQGEHCLAGSQLLGATCEEGVCVAVGGDNAGVAAKIVNGTPVDATPVAGTTALYSVSCGTPSTCVAVGQAGPVPHGVVVSLLVGATGIRVTSVTSVPNAIALWDVSCGEAATCFATAASSTLSSGAGSLVTITNGRPGAFSALHGQLPYALDCKGLLCEAVGLYGGAYPSAYRFDDGQYSESGADTKESYALMGLSCRTLSDCIGVGDGYPGGQVTRVKVVQVASATEVGSATDGLIDVACATHSACLAVGSDEIVALDNGKVESTTDARGFDALNAVICPTPRSCLLLGEDRAGNGGAIETIPVPQRSGSYSIRRVASSMSEGEK